MALCTVAPILVFGLINYRVAFSTLEKYISMSAAQGAEKLSYYVAREMTDYFNLALLCSQDRGIVSALSAARDSPSLSAAQASISSSVEASGIARQVRYPFEYTYILPDGRLITNYSYSSPDGSSFSAQSAAIRGEPWYRELAFMDLSATRVFVHASYVYGMGGDMIYIARNVISEIQNRGVVLIGYGKYHLARLLANATVSPNSSIFIVDSSGACIAEGEENQCHFADIAPLDLGAIFAGRLGPSGREYRTIAGRKEIVNGFSFPLGSLSNRLWFVLTVTPLATIMKDVTTITYATFGLMTFCLLSLLAMVLWVDRKFLDPIIDISALMNGLRNGDTSLRSDVRRSDEVGQLAIGFNEMSAELALYIEGIQREEREKREYEIRALQAQINPHFIRNTLNVIRWMAELRRAEGISRAILSFMRLVDYNISGESMYATLRDEVANAEEFLYIQNLRYGNRFTGAYSIEAGAEDCLVLKLALQPLIENCIVHGLSGLSRRGEIGVSARLRGKDLVVAVSDNGKGAPPGILAAAIDGRPLGADGSGKIGLANVERRIKLNFGGDYGLSFESTEGEGTTVTMVVPAIVGSIPGGRS